jgi:hypothetical protein
VRAELRDELAQLERRIEREFDENLDLRGGALLTVVASRSSIDLIASINAL